MDLAKNQKEALTNYALDLGVTFAGDVEECQIYNEEGIMHDVTLRCILKELIQQISIEEIMYDVLEDYSVLVPVCVLEEFINK